MISKFTTYHSSSSDYRVVADRGPFENDGIGAYKNVLPDDNGMRRLRRRHGQVSPIKSMYRMKVCVNDHRIGSDQATVPDLDGPSCNDRGATYAAILANPDFCIRLDGSKNSRMVDADDLKSCPGYSYKIFTDANIRT
ncbi:hypothetical protein GCM10010052_07210 [Paenarthrobacter histidinolovorans]|nr:hypothetical protein GCM10010052_07210 [Paenarthrobacter histidinolovorans]